MDAKKEPPKFLPHFPQLETTGIAVVLIIHMLYDVEARDVLDSSSFT